VAEFRDAAKLDGNSSVRDALVDRLIQIAFTDRVIVIGYDRESETPIERVTSAECIKAIEVLQHYDMGKPAPATPRDSSGDDMRQRWMSLKQMAEEKLALLPPPAEPPKLEGPADE
jgi:hypothetical protein